MWDQNTPLIVEWETSLDDVLVYIGSQSPAGAYVLFNEDNPYVQVLSDTKWQINFGDPRFTRDDLLKVRVTNPTKINLNDESDESFSISFS